MTEQAFDYPFEPFRIKMVEPIRLSSRAERQQWLAEVGFDLASLPSEQVMVDLLTDSGTGAMSDRQWSAMLQADEAYANARSFYRFQRAVCEITGIPYVLPAHQGRSAEHLLLAALVRPGSVVLSNHHFWTTAANVRLFGGRPVDVGPVAVGAAVGPAFAGNVDPAHLRHVIQRVGAGNVPLMMMTLTDQEIGGQPVAVQNLRAVRAVLDEFAIPLYLDTARYAENAYFVRQREPGWQDRTVAEAARALFDCASGFVMSAKKDAIVNIGGALGTRDAATLERVVQRQMLVEGAPSYGGLAGRDLEAIATGLAEGLDEGALRQRIGQVAYLAGRLAALGVPVIEPPGGHAVFVKAGQWLAHLPPGTDPAQSLAAALYVETGVRAVAVGSPTAEREDGSNAAGDGPLVRLCIPWRTYTRPHLDEVVRGFGVLREQLASLPGLRKAPPHTLAGRLMPRWEPIA